MLRDGTLVRDALAALAVVIALVVLSFSPALAVGSGGDCVVGPQSQAEGLCCKCNYTGSGLCEKRKEGGSVACEADPHWCDISVPCWGPVE